jgi:hypothetical protein
MHRYRLALRAAIASEAKAYGFALVTWTGGALTATERGSPGRLGALAYMGGILVAMTIVVLGSFGGPQAKWESKPLPRFAFGAVHIGSVIVGVLAAWGVAAVVPGRSLAFLCAGFTGIIVFQVLLGFEIAFSIAEDPEVARPGPSPDPVRR